jgi:hypothetical protein
MDTQSQLLTTKETAWVLRTTPRALAVARCLRKDTPPFVRIGRRILYRVEDLENFLQKRVVNPAREVAHEG